MITLGITARDRITGFQGVVTGHAQYISGCAQWLLAPPAGKDGTFHESCWFDEQRLTRVKNKPVINLDNSATPGPDKPAPKR